VPSSCALKGEFAIGALHGFRCYDNIAAEHEMPASACTHSMPGFTAGAKILITWPNRKLYRTSQSAASSSWQLGVTTLPWPALAAETVSTRRIPVIAQHLCTIIIAINKTLYYFKSGRKCHKISMNSNLVTPLEQSYTHVRRLDLSLVTENVFNCWKSYVGSVGLSVCQFVVVGYCVVIRRCLIAELYGCR